MLQITWNTYPFKRELYKSGCRFDYEKKAYIWPDTNEIRVFCENRKLEITEIADIDIWEEFEVQQQNLRAEKRAEKYRKRAENYNEKADQTDISQQERDFLLLWEPIKVGHHSERRHRKLIEKSNRTMDKKMEFYNKSEEAEWKAEYRENRKFYTKAEKEERKNRAKTIRTLAEKLRISEHKIWDTYLGWHTTWTIEKINNKTVRLVNWGMRDIAYSQDRDSYVKRVREEHKI